MTLHQVLLTLAVATVPAIASIVAAVMAAKYAVRARAAEAEASRLRALEDRLASRKFELYEPFLRALSQMMLPGNLATAMPALEKAMPEFLTFITIWGSDKSLKAFTRYRLGASTNPPSSITLRLVSDFMLAAREDLRDGPTSADGIDVIGSRINDLYKNRELVDAFTMPFDELANSLDWTPPWGVRP